MWLSPRELCVTNSSRQVNAYCVPSILSVKALNYQGGLPLCAGQKPSHSFICVSVDPPFLQCLSHTFLALPQVRLTHEGTC